MKPIILGIIIVSLTATLAYGNTKEEIAKTIAAEAGGEGYTGMYLVANTIANRAQKLDKTPYQVVSQKFQYYGFTAKYRNARYLEVKKQADYLAENIMRLPDKTKGAIFFRQTKEPRFKWCKVETIKYKNHIFYRGE
jgi:spore germination cell wall hydrolase CwlJ-like protein